LTDKGIISAALGLIENWEWNYPISLASLPIRNTFSAAKLHSKRLEEIEIEEIGLPLLAFGL